MTVVSDGLACVIVNWGVPDDHRNPATAGEITDVPQHGTAVFSGASARYIAEREYEGPDAFAYHATVRERLIALAIPTISGLFLASGKMAALIGAICGCSFRMTRFSPLSFIFSE